LFNLIFPFSFSFLFFVCKFVVALCFLGFAGVCDLRTRLVGNKVWVVFVPVGVVFAVVECLLFSSGSWLWLVGSWLLTVVVCLGVWRVGLFGGADCKCLICLGFCFPFFPLTVLGGFVWFVLFVAVVLGFGCNVSLMLFYNVVDRLRGWSWFVGLEDLSLLKKVVLLFCASRVRVERLGVDGFFWVPCEDGFGGVRVFGVRGADVVGVVERLRDGAGARSYVWAVRGVPLVWFLFWGLIVVVGVWLVVLLSMFFAL
jgi:Flp pilus assembly protein protease CpaA